MINKTIFSSSKKQAAKSAIANPLQPAGNNIRTMACCCFIITIITIIAFSPSLTNGFTNWDDGEYVVHNPDIRGFTVHNIVKIFSSSYVGNYQPITMLTFMVEYQFFKLAPAIYHFDNVLLHIINCLLVFVLIYSLSRKYSVSLIVALLFAINPLRVESVAWVTERKDLMSALFYFLSLLFYLRYLEQQNRKLYCLCGLMFLLALLSKPMAVSLPFILLLIYYLKNGHLSKKAIIGTIPWFAIAAVFVAITVTTQNITQPCTVSHSLSILQRIGVPFYGLVFYAVKSVVPLHLCAFYPYSENLGVVMNILLFASPFIVMGLVATIYFFRTYSRKLIFGSLFFLVAIIPVLQIIPVGNAMVAERYSYIPLIGLYFIFANFYVYLLENKYTGNNAIKTILIFSLTITMIVYSFLTYERCSVWKDSITLWNDVLKKHAVDAAYYFRGSAYASAGDNERAIEDYDKAISINPNYGLAYEGRGGILFNKGNINGAIGDFTRAIELLPTYARAFSNRGAVYSQKGDYDRAIADYTEAIRLRPSDAYASYSNRGMAYCHKSEFDRAINDFNKVLKMNPRFKEVYYYCGLAYKAKGDNYNALYNIKKACNLGFDLACHQLSGN